jgi:rRNA-processing protein FCF1
LKWLKSDTSSTYKKFLANGFTLLITSITLHELKKKGTELTKGKDLSLLFHDIKLVDSNNPQIIAEATKIWAHFPDNIIIASAKQYKAVLLSYDQILLGIAKYEGISAYTPEQFLRVMTCRKTNAENIDGRYNSEQATSSRFSKKWYSSDEMVLVKVESKENGETIWIYRPRGHS